LWRMYNDETVRPVEEKEVFGPLVSTGLVYVRADLAEQYTEAVCRYPEGSETNGIQGTETEAKDVKMEDSDGGGNAPPQTIQYNDVQILDGVKKE